MKNLLNLSIICSCLILQIHAQNSEQHPYILNLSQEKVYDYELETDHYKITVPATKIDWEDVMHQAAANFDLKVIFLPQKEALFSLAVSIEVLHHQLESSFFKRPLTYTKFFKKYLTTEEQEYLAEQRERVKAMTGLAQLSLWRMIFDNATNTRQYELVSDSLISLGYKTPGHDAEDLDAVISAYLGYHYMEVKDYNKALKRFEHCYEIRKKRKDRLDVNRYRLEQCYKQLGKKKELKAFQQEVLALYKEAKNAYPTFSHTIITEQYQQLAEEDLQAAVDYFENVFLPITKLYDFFWEEPGYLPYSKGIQQAKNDQERIYWVDKWIDQAKKNIGKKFNRYRVYRLLEILKQYPSKAIEEKRLKIFEEFAFSADAPTKWSSRAEYRYRTALSADERFWFHQVPYGRLLQYEPLVNDKKALLDKWMQQALKTKNDSIIEATALSVSKKLLNYGFQEQTKFFFEEYYCKKRLHHPINKYQWYEQTPYSGKDEYLETLVELANTYANHRIAATLYYRSLIYLTKPSPELRYERYLKAYELYKENLDRDGMRWQLRLILASCKKLPLSQRMNHAIEHYELSFGQQYSLGLSPLNVVVGDVLRGKVSDRKEIKKSIRLLKKWQKKLKKGDRKMKAALDWAENNELLLKKKL